MTEVRETAQTELQSKLTSKKESAITKYMDIAIGKRSLLRLVAFECIMLLCVSMPGALGLALRKLLFPRILGSCGRGVIFGRNITLRHPHKIHLGNNVIIDDLCVLDAKGDTNEGIHIGDNVIIARNTVVSCKGGNISIGDNSNISLNCMIHSESSVTLGKNILIAAYTYIIGGGSHDFERVDVPIIQQGSTTTGIHIEDNVWIGAGVKVLDGSAIGRDSIIAAASVVNRTIAPFSIAAGMPARVVKRRKQDDPGTQQPSSETIS